MGSNSLGQGPADLLVALDRSEPRRLRAQLEHALRDGIRSGRLPAGTALPPSRVLAADIAVARSVVVQAYEQLIAEGYLQARQGAGTRVMARAGSEACSGAPRGGAGHGARALSGLPDLASFPRREWLRHYRAVLNQVPDAAFGYPDTQGVLELRR
ncbi:MAG: GntR family transcriptional regulator, partial [Micrococcales bacterium]|nr:GntR family transcriptional regulator [Micrococcales bacterium]